MLHPPHPTENPLRSRLQQAGKEVLSNPAPSCFASGYTMVDEEPLLLSCENGQFVGGLRQMFGDFSVAQKTSNNLFLGCLIFMGWISLRIGCFPRSFDQGIGSDLCRRSSHMSATQLCFRLPDGRRGAPRLRRSEHRGELYGPMRRGPFRASERRHGKTGLFVWLFLAPKDA